jgi:predicted small metal-binding protein
MAKLIRCECGFLAYGNSDDEVVAAIGEHMRTDHPEVLARVDRQEIESWIEQA